MQDYRNRRARAITPYTAGEQPKDGQYIKLNTNENPYPPSPRVLEAITKAVEKLPLYPPTDGGSLREAIGEVHGLPVDHIFVGNSSDEVLALSFLTFFDEERLVCSPEIGYSFYPVYASLYDIPYRTAPLDEKHNIDLDALTGQGSVVLANPNAPTSCALPLARIEAMAKKLQQRGDLLLVDEAYIAFGSESALPLIHQYENLLIVRTFSKSHALAGARIGYAMGQPHLISALMTIKDSFNSYPLDHLAIAAGTAAMLDQDYLAKTTAAIIKTRERFSQGLRDRGFVLNDSASNFVFARHPKHSGKALFEALKTKMILVRRFDKEPIGEYLRISIGTDGDMDRVLAALDELGVSPCV